MDRHKCPAHPGRKATARSAVRASPIGHVAAEAGISRRCLSKWVNRYRSGGEAGLQDRASVLRHQPATVDPGLGRQDRDNSSAAEMVGPPHRRRASGRGPHRLPSPRSADGLCARASTGAVSSTRMEPVSATPPDIRTIGARRGEEGRPHPRHGRMAHARARQHSRQIRQPDVQAWHPHRICVPALGRRRVLSPLPHRGAARRGRVTVVGLINRAELFFAAHGIALFTRVVTDSGAC
jgi:transposase-like protein